MNLKLRTIRKIKGYTQKELADALNTSRRIVGAWERQDSQIPFESACNVADFLDCSLDELAGREARPEKYSDPRQAQLNAEYSELSEHRKNSAVDTVHGLYLAEKEEQKEKSKGKNADSSNNASSVA